MKVVEFAAFGPPHQVADCVERDDPGAPADDEVVIEIEAFPINPADLLTIEGRYAVRPPLPARLGAEAAGRIVAAGAGVRELAVGDRVISLERDNWVQRRKVKASRALKVSAEADPLQLAMLKVNPATALLMLREYVALQADDWVIQDAANSGVGHCLAALARADGIHTVNVVRREAAAATLRAAGADVVVVDGEDLAERVREATGGAPIRLGIDAVAGEICMRLADCMADGATLVNYGLLSGRPCMLRADQVVFKGITLTGFWLAKVLGAAPRARVAELYGDLVRRIADGSLRVEVEATYAIEDIKDALAHAAREGRRGKVLVTPNGPPG